MIGASALSPLAPEFEEFLFAPIGEGQNGMVVSVLSAFARLDIDPWQEAAKLARLPAAMATERLAAFIAAISDKAPANQELEAIAARLIKLLPHPSRASRLRETEGNARASANLQIAMCVVYAAIFIAFALGSQFIQENHGAQGKPGAVQVAASPAQDTTFAP
jgi:hypothetical protein